jgi:hypothetical protein
MAGPFLSDAVHLGLSGSNCRRPPRRQFRHRETAAWMLGWRSETRVAWSAPGIGTGVFTGAKRRRERQPCLAVAVAS